MLDTFDNAMNITARLGGKWHGAYGMACCPIHEDKRPSLSIRPGERTVLFTCHAGCSSRDIAAEIAKMIGNDGYRPRERSQNAEQWKSQPTKDYRELAISIWRGLSANTRGTPTEAYLNSRAISHIPACIRHDPHAKYRDENNVLQTGQALTCLYSTVGEPVSIQRTFLTKDGAKLDIEDNKRFLGERIGSAAELAPAGEILGLAEGNEDGLSVMDFFDLACWAVGGAKVYRHAVIPDHVKHIVIFTQHGAEAARCVEAAIEPLSANGRRTVDVEFPAPKMDWNDMAQAGIRPHSRGRLKAR